MQISCKAVLKRSFSNNIQSFIPTSQMGQSKPIAGRVFFAISKYAIPDVEALRCEKYLLGSHITISIDMAQSHSVFNEVNKVVKCHFVPLDSADI
jgi:hypothetical protein